MHEATFKMLHEPFNYQLLSKMDVWLPSSLKKSERCTSFSITAMQCGRDSEFDVLDGWRPIYFSQALWLLQAKDVCYYLAAQ